MPLLAKQSSMNTTGRKMSLIEYHFDDPVLQAEFNALTNKGIDRIKKHGTVSFEEMKAMLGVE